MKRANLIDRWMLLSERRQQLLEAARLAAKTHDYVGDRLRTERELEKCAIEFSVAVQRYVGGQRP